MDFGPGSCAIGASPPLERFASEVSLCDACAGRSFPLFFASHFFRRTPPPRRIRARANAKSPHKPLTKKDRNQQARKLAKESASQNTWLTEDVIYIITKEEKDAFLRLTTNEERDQFIEELAPPQSRFRLSR